MSEVFDYDAELARYTPRLREAADIGTDDRVLDIGCGAGQTTREAARSARSGRVMGIDLSATMVDRARELSEEEGLRHVSFERADAQSHRFAPEQFSVGISRFGTMFFADPVAAFANIGSAMQPGARLVQLVWQEADRQEWVGAIGRALTGRTPAPLVGGAFSLADPAATTAVLRAAGFTAIEIADVREPVYYGSDPAGARDALADLGMIDHLVSDLAAAGTARALDRLLAVLDAHDAGEGVWFDSAAWLVIAHRAR